MVNRFERFLYDISQIYYGWHRIADAEMGKLGLKGAYAVYMTQLSHYPQGITAAQLAEKCSRNKADVSRAVAAFEQAGLVTRQESSPRGYRARICLTPKGEAVAETVCQSAMRAVSMAGAGLSEEERAVFYRALDLIAANLTELANQGGQV